MESLKGKFSTVFFDADDTLWENEQFFRNAEAQFAELLADYTSPEGVQQMLWQKQEVPMLFINPILIPRNWFLF